jgi:glycosyltransferase involved in cell wall biosynthesis
MDVLLVDLILGSHSVPFASNIKQELETRDGISSVDFLTLERDDRLDNYFDATDDVYFIYEEKNSSVGYYTPIVDSFQKMVEFIQQNSYDVVHVLQIDNVLVESALVLNNFLELPPIVAQINGAFFGKKGEAGFWGIHRLLSKLLSSPLAPVIKTGIVRQKSRGSINELSLYHCVQKDVFAHILVHTTTAKEYLLNLGNCTTPVSIVPEPPTIDSPTLSKERARERIGVDPEQIVLLFFGGLRKEKGISRLLRSLRDYNGPDFTLLIAGPEKSVTEEEIRRAEQDIDPNLSTHIKYIYDSEQYFVAADGILCPYLDDFGEERTSHVFQEAIKLNRPVICPSFGSFESRLKSYDLGIRYSPNTDKALNNAIHDFVENPERWYSTVDMSNFSERHSFGNLCTELIRIYKSVL